MNANIVFIDDADFALRRMAACRVVDTQWVLVACAPKITRRASRWGNRSTLEKWRNKWARSLFDAVLRGSPQLRDARVSMHISNTSVQQMTAQLQAEHPQAVVLDWRRPKAISEPPMMAAPPPLTTPRPAVKLIGSALGVLGILLGVDPTPGLMSMMEY